MAPKQLRVPSVEQFSFKPVVRCQKRVWTGVAKTKVVQHIKEQLTTLATARQYCDKGFITHQRATHNNSTTQNRRFTGTQKTESTTKQDQNRIQLTDLQELLVYNCAPL